jgi:asparagine synthase (glutamine-hydrolysing)
MCGICGKLIFKDSIPSPGSIRAMCKTIIHRGPDDENIYTAPHIGLGQRCLFNIMGLPFSAALISGVY